MIAQIANFITWHFNPNLISEPITIRWYGAMFAIGFIAGAAIIAKMFKHEGEKKQLGRLAVYRRCHLHNHRRTPRTRIFLCLGLLFATSRRNPESMGRRACQPWRRNRDTHRHYFLFLFCHQTRFLMDRRPLGRAGSPRRRIDSIRQPFNSEIFGHATTMPWGFYFVDSMEWREMCMSYGQKVACHPTQIYEALCYFAIFGLLMYLYWRRNAEERQGLLSGIFFVAVFAARFLIEFVKNPQESFELEMTLNMGQVLSIPFIVAGIILIIYAMRNPRVPIEYKNEFAPETKKR